MDDVRIYNRALSEAEVAAFRESVEAEVASESA